MKELSIEEKAKRFDEAFGKAKKYHKDCIQRGNLWFVEDMEDMFPELKESDDERVSKEISTYISNVLNNVTQLTPRTNQVDEWLSWLKKQGERKSAEWTEDDEIKVKAMCEEGNLKPSERVWLKYLRYRVTKKKSDVYTERDRKIINTICESIQGHFKLSDVCKEDAVRYLHSLEGRIQSEKEWTGEDYKVYKSIIDDAVNNDLALTSIQKVWLKSLCSLDIKSVEDTERELAVLLAYVLSKDWSDAHVRRAEGIINSIKPCKVWKPSEEQMKAIGHICDGNYNVDLDILDSIYKDFKKLREE